MTKSFIESSLSQQDLNEDVGLRPQSMLEFEGQEHIREQLDILIGACKQRKDVLGHVLFSGPPGLGKTTLSHIIANSMGTNIVITSGPVIEKAGDMAGLLTKLQEGDILFIDEIHRLNRVVEEYLYPAMEDFQLDLMIDSGVTARSVQVKLNKFTLVGATTRVGLLSAPLRSRFHHTSRLEYYRPNILEKILLRTCKIFGIIADSGCLQEIAARSRGTPRIANNLLRWVRDYAQMKQPSKKAISKETARLALSMLSIDEKGLDEMDLRLLRTVIDAYHGGPVGLQTLAIAVGEEMHTIEEVYEPFLIMQGFLKRTPRGRMAMPAAFEHLGRTMPKKFLENQE